MQNNNNINNDDEQLARYVAMLDDNVNISKTSDGKEFMWLVTTLILIVLGIYVTSDIVARIAVNNISYDTQVKIENFYRFQADRKTDLKYHYETQILNKIKSEIVNSDSLLKRKNDFPLYIVEEKDVNAMISPDGTIVVTSGLLKEIKDEQAYSFILAHELGHYKHRDHLKSLGRQFIWQAVSVVFGGSSAAKTIAYNTSNLNELSYSQKQELLADSFANNYVLNKYGTNKPAKDFFAYLDKKEQVPAFLHYFSTHPSSKKRIENLKKQYIPPKSAK